MTRNPDTFNQLLREAVDWMEEAILNAEDAGETTLLPRGYPDLPNRIRAVLDDQA